MSAITNYILDNSKKNDKRLKYDFMPSILEIIEKPAHIGGKIIIYGIFVILISTVLWACFSKLDVVVTAGGSVKPVGDMKIIQSSATGTVKGIYANVGQFIRAGDTLMELDCEVAGIDVKQINAQIAVANVQLELYQRIIIGDDITEISLDKYDEALRPFAQFVITVQKDHFINLKSLETQKNGYEIEQQISQGLGASEPLLEQKRLLIEQAELNIESALVQFNGRILNQIAELTQNINALNAQLKKTSLEKDSLYISSPVDGYIQKIEVNTIGAVVTAAQNLMVVIPSGVPVEMECFVKNMDIADVFVGDKAEIKLDAYPYSKYGIVTGTVTYISPSSFTHEQLGSVYLLKVEIGNSNKNIDIVSGLTGSAEIKVGRRSVMSYFLDPIIKGFGESLREK